MVKRTVPDRPIARNVHVGATLDARAYAALLVEVQTAAHTYYLGSAREQSRPQDSDRAASAARAMDASWSIAEHHRESPFPDMCATMAWCTIAARWTATLARLLPLLALPIATEYRRRIDNWRALAHLPVVPEPRYDQNPLSVTRSLKP
jgi:hypothetical protein